MTSLRQLLLLALVCTGLRGAMQAELLTNGGFENGMKGWRPLWTREANTGSSEIDSKEVHSGHNALRIEHTGSRDLTMEPMALFSVEAGDRFDLEAWVKLSGTEVQPVTLCVETLDVQGNVQSWIHGAVQTSQTGSWQKLQTRITVPPGIAKIKPRLLATGPITIWLDDMSMKPLGNFFAQRPKNLPATFTLTNSALSVTLDTRNATLVVTDQRTREMYRQKEQPLALCVTAASAQDNTIRFALSHSTLDAPVEVTLRLDADTPEFTIELSSEGPLPRPLKFPAPFLSESGDALVLAVNEGLTYPVDDEALPTQRFIAFGGHSYSMPFWGVVHGEGGHVVIIETPNDATLRTERRDGRLVVAPEWESQRGQFGYPRRLRYVFFDKGRHVAMAKRYRAYAQQTGLFKTLAQKRESNPNVDLLVGAVNVWYFGGEAVAMAKEMKAAGIERMLWSSGSSGKVIAQLNDLDLLTSRYDLYQDIMNPENFPKLQYKHNDWIAEAWPKDIILNADGKWRHGWEVEAKDGTMIPCGVLCDKLAPDYARKRIGPELEIAPYRCRFIDTTTAAPWNECYNPDHPMTRTESRHWKMELLRIVSEEFKLVTGTETGHDAAVPYVHYFEGMLSLTPYRLRDAGRHMDRIVEEVPENLRKFQVGPEYRLPLWELVYHECVVAQWYWGDYNNKLPAIWDRRDLFNILYATPPMFLFKREFWLKNKDRFVQSYQNICPLVRSVGYSEMTDHRFLTPDRSVQQTVFSNGTTITVNFGTTPFSLPDGTRVGPAGFHVQPPVR
ncbi:MAG: hypothetical protein B9S32_14990 [Verrucomicrobia bacterium Tous-C9LFEB]|nr:MAG: hypothetical protein B9S32_14990 [Verrucomicrobia bacterium Tous-C9LFEB]